MSGTVLIIEDDKRIANWVKVYFERAGFSAEVAHDGETGLDLARFLNPDLIILDLMLPRLDGVGVCKILRRDSDVPIIMLTAREAHVERINSGADDYIVKPFAPEEVIARAEAVLRRVRGRTQQILTRNGITLNETTKSVTVNDAPLDLSQALGNALSNAINCTEPGGNIVLRAEAESGESLIVSIIDDGIGIDAADLPHIFDRFYRTEQSRDRGIGGTGLGLAIVRAIVEAHGGTVAVTSDGDGHGATVTLRLPLNE